MQNEEKGDKYKHYKKQKCVYEALITRMVTKCGCFPGEFGATGNYYREAKINTLRNDSREVKLWQRTCGYPEHAVCVAAVLQSWDWQASTCWDHTFNQALFALK